MAGGGVRQPQAQIVAHDVDKKEDADCAMEVVGQCSLGVQVSQDNVDLIDKGGWDHERHKEEGPNIRHLTREDVLAA